MSLGAPEIIIILIVIVVLFGVTWMYKNKRPSSNSSGGASVDNKTDKKA